MLRKLGLVLLMFWAVPVWGATLNIYPLGDVNQDQLTFEAAVAAANSGDEILMHSHLQGDKNATTAWVFGVGIHAPVSIPLKRDGVTVGPTLTFAGRDGLETRRAVVVDKSITIRGEPTTITQVAGEAQLFVVHSELATLKDLKFLDWKVYSHWAYHPSNWINVSWEDIRPSPVLGSYNSVALTVLLDDRVSYGQNLDLPLYEYTIQNCFSSGSIQVSSGARVINLTSDPNHLIEDAVFVGSLQGLRQFDHVGISQTQVQDVLIDGLLTMGNHPTNFGVYVSDVLGGKVDKVTVQNSTIQSFSGNFIWHSDVFGLASGFEMSNILFYNNTFRRYGEESTRRSLDHGMLALQSSITAPTPPMQSVSVVDNIFIVEGDRDLVFSGDFLFTEVILFDANDCFFSGNDYRQSQAPGDLTGTGPITDGVMILFGSTDCIVHDSGGYPVGQGGAKDHVTDFGNNRIVGGSANDVDSPAGIGQAMKDAKDQAAQALIDEKRALVDGLQPSP